MTISLALIQTLGQMRPWVLFVASVGSVAIAAVVSIAVWFLLQGVTSFDQLEEASVALMVGGTLFLNALMAIYPMSKLFNFATGCRQIAFTKSMGTLAIAMGQHRRFWKSWGILTIVAMFVNTIVALALFVTR